MCTNRKFVEFYNKLPHWELNKKSVDLRNARAYSLCLNYAVMEQTNQ